ncbi:retroviral-like aspartic protease family protein [Variovorax sp. ZS18.2.2]|uniref:retroviral-like aspartic protease family protein n=1 Tax=Variovorax sp. ZS18.2.2 TaxID=2971255 RepID=UPI0021517B7C|nr:retroviral-like aspartic protease family protein [Variovorax sp. ZS18.2.2]MCR6477405.1 retroviral-like aspartic protease family protein [Variovorax sp. ZS18.2.2]
MKPWNERHDPVLGESSPDGASAASATFLQDRRDEDLRAPAWLWGAAAIVFVAYATLSLMVANAQNASATTQAGVLIGAFFWPLLVVGVTCLWEERRNPRARVKTFLVTCLVFLVIAGITFLSVRGYGLHRWSRSSFSAADFKAQAVRCLRERDLACAESNWTDYVRLRPDESYGIVNLGIVLNQQDKHAEAVAQFAKALSLGEGAYDLFAYYADSLAKLGRTDEAIEWSYKALSVVPTLVDVRSKLAKLLVGAGRHYEALSALQAFDSQRVSRGQSPYFEAQRIAIESVIDAGGASNGPAEREALRLPAFGGHFFAPVTLGAGKPAPYMVDTGASRTTMSDAVLRDSKASFKVVATNVQIQTADGRKVPARTVVIESMKLGRFELRNVSAVTCSDCAALLGQSTLSQFDMQSSRVQGVEFLTLVPRGRQ